MLSPDRRDDFDDELQRWASSIANALTPAEFRALIREYRALSNNHNVPEADRLVARKRARHLRKAK